MVAPKLVDEDIGKGQCLLKALSKRRVKVDLAFWLSDTHGTSWKLCLAMPLVDRGGPLAAYRRIQSAIGSIEPPQMRLPLHRIRALSQRDLIAKRVREIISPGGPYAVISDEDGESVMVFLENVP